MERRVRILDPRTALICTCLLGVAAILSNRPEGAHAACAIGAICALAAGAWCPCLVLSAIYIAIAAAMHLVGGMDNTTLAVAVIMLSYIAQKFVVLALLGISLSRFASMTDMLDALQAMGAPKLILVPSMVMVRFFPTVREDASHLMESLKTRRVVATWGYALRHPALVCELIVVPLLMRCTRVSDELAASALARGLDSRTKPTVLQPLAFGWRDAVAFALTILACCVLAWIQFGPR